MPWALLGAKYIGVQQWMCEPVLGIEPATEDEESKPRPTQADKWIANLAAAGQFFEREGHLTVPRKHVETVLSEDGGSSGFVWGRGQRPAEQGRRAVLGAGGAAVRDRDAVGIAAARAAPGLVSLGAEAEVRRRRGKACPIRSAGRSCSDRLTAGPR
ncbi:hypothetical protein GCM10010336_50820 [Streptomyces goshikiensis]|nr:hypothetical protein GCM10010336_50820 [Streptomyces goshikiensis]